MMTDNPLEPGAQYMQQGDGALYSIAVSLKRIADVLCGDPAKGDWLNQLFCTLDNVSHNHKQRMS